MKKIIYSTKRKKKSPIGITIAILALTAAIFAVAFFAPWHHWEGSGPAVASSASVLRPQSSIVSPLPPEPEQLLVKFSAVGDNLIHNGLFLQAQNRAGGDGYDFTYAYEKVAYFFEDYDVNWINQETLINDEYAPSGYPSFSSPGPLGHTLYELGWNVFAISNNHTYDKGAGGIEATQAFWQTMPEDIVVYGLYNENDASEVALQEVNGITIAYLAYTEHTNGLPTPRAAPAHVIYTNNLPVMEEQVRAARTMADVVVVSVHWGVENSHAVTQAQRNLAASYASWGADVIIGTHPHVIQPVEWVESPEDGRQALVAYSLGNFISAQEPAQNLVGLALTYELALQADPDGTRHPVRIENVKVYPTVTFYSSGYNDIHDYMLRDYTDEIAARHARNLTPQYARELAERYIDPEFLVLD